MILILQGSLCAHLSILTDKRESRDKKLGEFQKVLRVFSKVLRDFSENLRRFLRSLGGFFARMRDAQCRLRLADAFYPEIPRKQQAHFSDTPLSILP